MKRITEYDNITTVEEADVLAGVDVNDTTQASSGSTKKFSITKIADFLKDRTETLTNKILTTARLNTPKINEDVTVTATSTELNKLDGMSGDAVGTTDTQTLTNKTLTSPVISALRGAVVSRQDNTTNSTPADSIIQMGWGFIRSLNGTTYLSKAVTFEHTFSAAPIVLITTLGIYNNASDPTTVANFTSAFSARYGIESIATTGFNAKVQDSSGSTNYCFGFTWIAIGPS